jgi:hypothetical protein
MFEAEATKGRDKRLEVRRIRPRASRDRRASTCDRHINNKMTVWKCGTMKSNQSARTNTNVPQISARLPLPGSLALATQHNKLDADLRTCA